MGAQRRRRRRCEPQHDVRPLLLDAERRHLGARHRLDAVHDSRHRRPAPVLEAGARTGRETHRILRQELRDDLDLGRIADDDQRRARRDHRLTLLRDAQHDARSRRGDGEARRARLRADARRQQRTARAALLRDRSVLGRLRRAQAGLGGIHRGRGDQPVTGQSDGTRRLGRGEFTLGGGRRAACRRGSEPSARLGLDARIEEPRRAAGHACDALTRTHRIARLDGDAQQTTRHRRRHHIDLAHPRAAFVHHLFAHRAAIDGAELDLDGARPERDGQHRRQPDRDRSPQQQSATGGAGGSGGGGAHSRDFNTATRSSRSTSRRTHSAAATTAATTNSTARA